MRVMCEWHDDYPEDDCEPCRIIEDHAIELSVDAWRERYL